MINFKNFLSSECVDNLLEISTQEMEWNENYFCPERLITDIDKYPVLKQVLDDKFDDYKLHIDKRIYFSKYEPNTVCKRHADPCKYTLIILLQPPKFGGNLMLVYNQQLKKANLSDRGDAVLFNGSTEHFITEILEGTRIALAIWFDELPNNLTKSLETDFNN